MRRAATMAAALALAGCAPEARAPARPATVDVGVIEAAPDVARACIETARRVPECMTITDADRSDSHTLQVFVMCDARGGGSLRLRCREGSGSLVDKAALP